MDASKQMMQTQGSERSNRLGTRPEDYFDMSVTSVRKLFVGVGHVWELVTLLRERISELVPAKTFVLGTVMEGAILSPSNVFVEEDAIVEPGVFIQGPCYIGRGAEVRHGAYIRGNVMLMEGAVLGHASEAKNSVFLPNAKAPHLAYVGDSILGSRANLGAGTKLSNLPITSRTDPATKRRPTISVWCNGERNDTALTKLGGILGDDVFTGCNSVLNPGTLLGPRSLVYPNVSVGRGVYPADSVISLSRKAY